jgi:hypothetical protein
MNSVITYLINELSIKSKEINDLKTNNSTHTNLINSTKKLINHQKQIYPKNILERLPKRSYQDYYTKFIEYIESQKQFDNLWMLIGGDNKKKSINLNRFKDDFDIVITIEQINLYDNELLALYLDDKSINKVYKTKISIYNNRNIYEILSQILPKKFSRIVFDGNFTDNFKGRQILLDLECLKELLNINGEIYVDSIKFDHAITNLFIYYNSKNDNWYIKKDKLSIMIDQFHEIHKGVLKDHYNYKLYLENGIRIYNIKKLFEKMDSNGYISNDDLQLHEITYTLQTEIQNNIEDKCKYLLNIFEPERFTIEHIVISDQCPLPYPLPAKDDINKILIKERYWKITRFA